MDRIVYEWDNICSSLGEKPSWSYVKTLLLEKHSDASLVLKIPEGTPVFDAITILPAFDEVWVRRESGLETCIKNRWQMETGARLHAGDHIFH